MTRLLKEKPREGSEGENKSGRALLPDFWERYPARLGSRRRKVGTHVPLLKPRVQ